MTLDHEVAKAVDKAKKPEDDTVTLSSGVVLRCKQVPPLLLIKVLASFPRPKIPTWISPSMGREVENPDDPDYIARVNQWKIDSSNVTLNALLLLGTELVSVPKNLEGPDGNKWIEKLKSIGLETETNNESWRYLNWMVLVAAPSDDDMNIIKEVVGKLSGVPESAVAAAEQFPGS